MGNRAALLAMMLSSIAQGAMAQAPAHSQALNAVRTAASAQCRAAWPGSLDVAYGAGERHRWDIFPAADPGDDDRDLSRDQCRFGLVREIWR